MALLTEIEVTGPLTAAVRAALADTLAQVRGGLLLVVASDGLAVDDLGDPVASRDMAALTATLAAYGAERGPTGAVLDGAVRGVALELALAAGCRVATGRAVMGFSDIGLGLVPAAGGTQRLPRLIGAEAALRLLLTGGEVTADEALGLGLVDRVAGEGAQPEARAAARAAARGLLGATPPHPAGLRDGRAYLASVAAARRGARGAAARLVDCVEMALLLPFEQGLAHERVCFDDLCRDEATLGLLHAAAVFGHAGGGTDEPPRKLGLWGGGAAAAGLVLGALGTGCVVQVAAAQRETVVQLLADVAERQEADVQAGRLTPDRREEDWSRLLPQIGTAGLDGVDLTVMTEAGPELAGPRVTFGCAPEAGAAALVRFDRLAEIKAMDASPAVVARVAGFARAMGWEPVVTARGGSVAQRLAGALAGALVWAEGQGLTQATISASLTAAGIAGDGAGEMVADGTALRCLAALANAGAQAIAAGEAASAAEVDAVAIAAGLMARRSGGPMHQANRRGLLVLRRDLALWQADDPALWTIDPLLDALAATGRGFS